MKKLFLVPSLLFTYLLNAQTEKGSVLVGPSFNIQNYKSDTRPVNAIANSQTNNQKNINVSLGLGYFIADNVVVGAYYQNSYGKREYDSNPTNGGAIYHSDNTDFMNYVGLFGRDYKMVSEKLGFFGNLELAYQFGKGKSFTENTTIFGSTKTETNSNSKGFFAGVRPGIVYFIKERIALEATFGSLSFNSATQVNYTGGVKTDQVKNENFNLDFGARSFFFGLNFYFGRKKA